MRSQASNPVERYEVLNTHHIVSMKLVSGLTPVLRPLLPYECEIPAGPSMYSGSGEHSRTEFPPVVSSSSDFLARISRALSGFNSANIGHIAIILFAFYSEWC